VTDDADTRVRQFRTTTGVTIETTRTRAGADVGLTTNSFNSVSLNPPMVLWSLAKSARSLPAFLESDSFAVHVLSASEQQLSRTFAERGADKFAGLALERGRGDIPLIPDCSARFQCRTAVRYEGGDHSSSIRSVRVTPRCASPADRSSPPSAPRPALPRRRACCGTSAAEDPPAEADALLAIEHRRAQPHRFLRAPRAASADAGAVQAPLGQQAVDGDLIGASDIDLAVGHCRHEELDGIPARVRA
jgi:flavin reductase (DIM6/NTAB) family NADH-FMN oxidoreductase RutF